MPTERVQHDDHCLMIAAGRVWRIAQVQPGMVLILEGPTQWLAVQVEDMDGYVARASRMLCDHFGPDAAVLLQKSVTSSGTKKKGSALEP